jgi:hypothetical protein
MVRSARLAGRQISRAHGLKGPYGGEVNEPHESKIILIYISKLINKFYLKYRKLSLVDLHVEW